MKKPQLSRAELQAEIVAMQATLRHSIAMTIIAGRALAELAVKHNDASLTAQLEDLARQNRELTARADEQWARIESRWGRTSG